MKKYLTTSNFFYALGIIFFIVAFGSIVYYQLTGLKLDFYHESSFPLLYAQTNLETQLPYSARFSGREIAPITWPLLQSILLFFGAKVSIDLHAITSVIFTFFTLYCCYLYCKVNKFSKFTFIFFTILIYTSFILPPSTYSWLDQVWVWPMNSYGIYDFYSLICLSLLINYINVYDKKKNKSLYFLLAVYFLFGLNGTRSLIMVTIPVIFGLIAYILSTEDPFNRVKWGYWRIAIALVVATVAGSIITNLIWHGIPQPFQDPQKVFGLNNREEFRDKISFFLHTWLTLFNGIPKPGTRMFSFEGIRHITNSVFSIMLLVIPFLRIKGVKSASEFITIYRYIFILFVIFTATVYGNASLSVRYLIPLAYATLFIVPFYFEDWIKSKKYGYIILIISLIFPAYIASVHGLTRYNLNSYKKNDIYQLSNFLESKGMSYGYGGPYETNILAVNQFSNSKVHLSIIDINPLRGHIHGDKIWYQPNYHEGSTFIAFPTKFWSENDELKSITKHSFERYEFGNWVIYTFNDNAIKYINATSGP